MRPITVLIAEDDPLTRLGIKSLLERYPDEFTLMGEATTGEEAVQRAEELQPDLVVMDVRMPKENGLEATRKITTAQPRTRVLILTMVDESESLFTALRNGAIGYVVKGVDSEEMLHALRAAGNGQAIFGSKIAPRLLHYFSSIQYKPDVMPPLSIRETEVLSLMAKSTVPQRELVGQVADKLVLARHTVQNHISNILTKLQVMTKAEAIQVLRNWEKTQTDNLNDVNKQSK